MQWSFSILHVYQILDIVVIAEVSEVSTFRGSFDTLLYVAGTTHSVLIKRDVLVFGQIL